MGVPRPWKELSIYRSHLSFQETVPLIVESSILFLYSTFNFFYNKKKMETQLFNFLHLYNWISMDSPPPITQMCLSQIRLREYQEINLKH